MYLLLDTNMILGYYLPRSMNHVKARDRIKNIINSVRSGKSDHFFYLPNICIAEAFSNLAKYSFGQNNRHVIKNGGTIDTRVYQSLCNQLQKDIHNGKLFYQLEVSRYHVLAVDLIAPIDHYFKIGRNQKYVRPAGTFDQLIVGMSVHLAHIHGQENVALLTTDTRLANLVKKCRQDIPEATKEKLKLHRANDVAGKDFGPDIFPEALHLGNCSNKKLLETFGQWPLPVGNIGRVNRDTG